MKKIFTLLLVLITSISYAATGWFEDYVIISVDNNTPAYYWIGTDPNYGTELNNHSFGTISSLIFTGSDMKYWSDNKDRTDGAFYYKIVKVSDGTVVTNSIETIWTQTYLSGNNYQGNWSGSKNILSGLSPNTEYKLEVWAKSWGTSQGDDYLSNDGANYVATFTTSSSYMWIGISDNDWSSTSNWNFGLPSSSDDVVIPSGLANYPTINESPSSPATCNNLIVNSSASLTINPGKALTVSGDFTNNGTLALASNANGNGSLIVNGTISGNVTAQRYIGAYSAGDNGWHLLSSPVNNMAISSSDFAPGGNDDLYAWDEPTYTWLNYKDGNNNISNFTDGKGYLVAYDSTATKSFTGTPNNSDITFSNLSYNATGNGWHLLGNPYPSALKWGDANWSLTGVGGVAQVWDESAGNYTTVNSGGVIPSTNGFFVQVSSATNSLTIPKTDRVHDATNNFKTSTVQHKTLKFKVTNDANSYYDNNTFGFKSEATDDYDLAFDSHKMFSMVNTAPQLWTVMNGQDYSTNFMAAPEANKSVALDFKSGVNSTYHLSWTGMDNMDPNLQFILEDKQTGQEINMRDYSQYDFSATTDDSNDRFVLHINGANGIPQTDANNHALIYSYGHSIYIKAKNKQLLNGKVVLNNLLGQVIYRTNINGTSQQTLSTNLNTGVYIVRYTETDGYTQAQKVIIN